MGRWGDVLAYLVLGVFGWVIYKEVSKRGLLDKLFNNTESAPSISAGVGVDPPRAPRITDDVAPANLMAIDQVIPGSVTLSVLTDRVSNEGWVVGQSGSETDAALVNNPSDAFIAAPQASPWVSNVSLGAWV